MKFNKGDIVKFNESLMRSLPAEGRALSYNSNNEYELKYFIDCYTKEHYLTTVAVNNFNVEYVVLPTTPMPVFSCLEDGKLVTYYPIQERRDTHSKKFFVAETYLEKVGSIYDEEPEEEVEEETEEEDETLYEEEWDSDCDNDEDLNEEINQDSNKEENESFSRSAEYLKIHQNITNVINSLENVIESLSKIIKHEINKK